MEFREYVQQYMQDELNVDYLLDQIRYGLLRDLVENCFRKKGFRLSQEKKAEIILSVLFSLLTKGFSFEEFLTKVPQNERKRFLSSLLYHIYYLNLPPEYLVSSQRLFFYLFRTLALEASLETIASIFNALSYSEKLKCLGFCFGDFDEGAHRIIRYASKNCPEDVKKLITLLERKLARGQEVASWIYSQQEIDPLALKTYLKKLEKGIDERIERVATSLTLPLADVKRCLWLFGLYDHQVPKDAWYLQEHGALDDKLLAIQNETKATKSFVQGIKEQIEALAKTPESYIRGLDLITYALPTMGKDLSLLSWAPSIVEGLELICRFFQIENQAPIIVFDQSEKKLFRKNAKYLKSLKAPIIHLDTDQILQLAKKLNLQGLLVTDVGNIFGYGGARNAIFLLAPLIRYYHRKGLNDLSKISKATLRRDFKAIVLEEKQGPCLISMGDDDVHIPPSTLFSDALFAFKHQKEFFSRVGWMIGRRTTWTESTFDLKCLLKHNSEFFLQHSWSEEPFVHGMAGLLAKPKICLNLPFPQEEAQFRTIKEYVFDFRQPSMHLSGYRFPKANLPSNRFSGFADFLRTHYKYSIGMMLVSDLLDPLNLQNRCALPWNKILPLPNLLSAIQFIVQPKNVKEMQKQVHKNAQLALQALRHYQPEKEKEATFALFYLGFLDTLDIPEILAPYQKEFGKETKELAALFADLQHDASCFKEVLSGSTKRYAEKKLPFTHALKLLQRLIDKATFQKELLFLQDG